MDDKWSPVSVAKLLSDAVQQVVSVSLRRAIEIGRSTLMMQITRYICFTKANNFPHIKQNFCSNSGMNTRQFKTLLAIAKRGTIADAAAEVSLTPSALSQQVRALERELNVDLFDRSTRPPTLNTRGLLMVEAAQSVLSTIEGVQATLSGRGVVGTLDIGAVRTSAMALIPQAIVALRRLHPELRIKLRVGSSESLLGDVMAERVDVAIIADRIAVPETLHWRPFIREPLLVIAPPGTPNSGARKLLSDYPYIRFSSNVPLAHIIDAEMLRIGVAPTVVAEVDMVWAITESVRQGLGVAVVPHLVLRSAENKTLVHEQFGQPPVYRQIGLVQRRRSPKADLITKLHEQLSRASAPYGI